ncbi:hypothetical protein ACOME3_000017 [Neoechinorhynchus agilis]
MDAPLKYKAITVDRPASIDDLRSRLPIIMEEYSIMEKILENQVVLVCGETGSGKTTQLPQFLYEYGFTHGATKMIGISEPRRAAASSMSEVVAEQLNLPTNRVSFQTRYEGNVTDKTVIKFMTDGILLKEIQAEFLLSKYSVIIVDEAHERSVYSDILLGLLTRIVERRNSDNLNPMRLIIMSATMEYEGFTRNRMLFRRCPPVVHIGARQYPVQKIYSSKRRKRYKEEREGIRSKKKWKQVNDVVSNLINESYPNLLDEDDALQKVLQDTETNRSSRPLYLVPLYAALPANEQRKARQPPPLGSRLCVISTNVAEVSLTIPGISHVSVRGLEMKQPSRFTFLFSNEQCSTLIDTGKEKVRTYNRDTGASRFVIRWISKASASQRTGRAGRVCDGYCHRLYSTAVFTNDFADYSEPEILRRPLEDVILQMRRIGVDVDVGLFPYPTPPKCEDISIAERLLVDLGALERIEESNRHSCLQLTSLGMLMADFPINPRYAKILLVASKLQVFPYASVLVSALNSYEYFVDANRTKEDPRDLRNKLMKQKALTKHHRMLGDLFAYLLFQVNAEMISRSRREQFCDQMGISPSAAHDAKRIRSQIFKIARKQDLGVDEFHIAKLGVLDGKRAESLRKAVACGMVDKLARKNPEAVEFKGKKVKHTYLSANCDPLIIHPKSTLSLIRPEYVCYQELLEINERTYMVGVCGIDVEWIPEWLLRRLFR